MRGPALEGVRVLEVGNFIAGPFCAMQLADLGADVVKVERPGVGDIVRATGPFLDGESSPFLRFNRNKRSLALDLQHESGKAVFKRLARQADVVVENLSPGAMARLGLSYDHLVVDNPGLIYVAASGWGQDGPYAQMSGLDIIVQAMSGLMSITGEPDRPPVKVGVPVTDLVCALYGAMAALTALYVRKETGEGQFVDVSLFESGVSLAVWEAGRYFATGETPRAQGTVHPTVAPYQAVRSSDGYFTLGAPSPQTFAALCAVIGREDLAADPRFSDNAARHANREALIEAIESVTTTAPMAHWMEALSAVGVPCGSIRSYDAVFHDPHLEARGFFVDLEHPRLGPIRQLGSPLRMEKTPPRLERNGPGLGEHSREVLLERGFSPDEVALLLKEGVVAG